MKLSAIIPVFNEKQNVVQVYTLLTQVLKQRTKEYEIIFIDDFSTDGTFEILQRLKANKKDKNLRVAKLKKQMGQTTALAQGFLLSKGDIIISLDGDMQNDPRDIPLLLDKLNEGYDFVSGWRYERHDKFLSKKIPSLIANSIRRIITKDPTHDAGCSLKAYRRYCFENLNLFGEMHRYLNTIMYWNNYKIAEVKVTHRPRQKGVTKYNNKRIFRGFLDLLDLTFWYKYSTTPQHFFGRMGIYSIMLSFSFVVYHLVYGVIYLGKRITVGPLLLLSVLLFVIGIQFICFGFIGEMQMQLYHLVDKNQNFIEKEI